MRKILAGLAITAILALAQAANAQFMPDTWPFENEGDPEFFVRPTGRLLVGYTAYNQMDYDKVIAYPGSPDDERGFALNNAELGLNGHVLFDWLTVKLLGEAQNRDGERTDVALKYAFMRLHWTHENWEDESFTPYFGGTIGAQKIPFSRQSLAGEGDLQFIRRAMAVEQMPIRYDVGATFEPSCVIRSGDGDEIVSLDLAGGAFNGREDKQYGRDDNDNRMYVARARVDLFGPMETGEGDLTPLESEREWIPQISLGASLLQNNDLGTIVKAIGYDAEIRWAGVSVSGEMIATRFEPDVSDDIIAEQFADDWETSGWHVQGGWFVIPRHVELAARYEEFRLELLTDDLDDRLLANTTAGLNVHFATRHRLKLQANYVWRAELEGMPEIDNDTVTLQAGLQF
ncbi:OprO/OprP family phosphate-selective porin [bacterium]|nr:OprO/OprP family phosphate-selective porin [bacterium]